MDTVKLFVNIQLPECANIKFITFKCSKYQIEIIEKLSGNGRRNKGFMDPSLTQTKEAKWRLHTAFPFSLKVHMQI